MKGMPSVEETLYFYPKEYIQYHPRQTAIVSKLYERFVKAQAQKIRELIGPTGRILDIGCACGEFMKYVKELGDWEITGIEISPEAVEIGRSWGLDIRQGTFESVQLDDNQFDLIIFTHIIEHLTDPMTGLERVYRLLKPNGYLFGETENIDSLAFKMLKRYWGLLHMPRHLYFFAEDTLHNYLQKTGFTDISLNHTFNPGGWAIGFQCFIEEKLFHRIHPGRTWYYPYLLVASMPLAFGQLLFRKTCAINFIGRKR
jgi:ubiquinone/menaquinone biosynthesis C-methylase UbiE